MEWQEKMDLLPLPKQTPLHITWQRNEGPIILCLTPVNLRGVLEATGQNSPLKWHGNGIQRWVDKRADH